MKSTHILSRSIAALLTLNVVAHAQSTWSGGGGNAFWSTALNWSGGSVPVSPTGLIFDGTVNLNPSNDLIGFTANGITFGPTAGAFTLSGNPITLAGDVVNNSTNLQTINFDLDYSTVRTFNTAAGNITLSGTLNGSTGAQLLKTGTGTLTIASPNYSTLGNSGPGLIAQAGTLRLNGGEDAYYNVTGETRIGDTSNQNVSMIVDSGTLGVSSWLAVARGNGTGNVSSDLVLNNSARITTANLSVGFNAGNTANTPRGTVTLNGSSTLEVTNGGNLFHIAESAGSNITIRLNDTSVLQHNVAGATSRIGVGGKAVLNIASPNATASFNQVHLGAGGNSGAGLNSGAIWNRGVLTVSSGASINHFSIGQSNGSYGYYLHDSATPLTLREVGLGGASGTNDVNGGNGVLEVRSGTTTVTDWLTINRTTGQSVSSMLLVAGGTLVTPDISGHFEPNWSTTADQYTVIDVGTNGRIDGGANSQISLNHSSRAGHFGLLTIHGGGVVETPNITGATAGTTVINFDNGTLVAEANNGALIGNVFDGVFIHQGGATINTNGFNSTIPAVLATPTGNGLTSIPLTAGGSGYIGRPVVTITGGGGIGATAVANFDEATGVITGITITSPGSGYTSAPTITLIGGGGSGATLGTATLAAVSGGALTKAGQGTLTLSAANTYTGGTTISGGILSLSNNSGSGTGTGAVVVNTGGTLAGAGITTGPISVNNGGTLSGTGTHSGGVTVASGGVLAPGTGIGTLTVGSLTLNAGSILNYEVTDAATLDRIAVTNDGGLTINGGGVNLYIPGGSTGFSANGVYNLIGYSGTISGAGISALGVLNKTSGKTYTFGENAGFVTLTVATAGATPNFWNVDANGNWTTDSNWTLGTAPNGAGAIANFGGGGATITQPRTITLDAARTVGSIGFNSTASYTIAGTNTLTLNNGAVPDAEITVTNGSHTIETPIVATSTGTVISVVNSADKLTLSGPLSGSTTVTKLGAGTLVLSGTNSYTGVTTLAAGTLEISGDSNFGSSITASRGSTLRVTGANATVSKPLAFDLAGGAATGIAAVANAPANFTINVPAGSNATISSAINVVGGSMAKTGDGTLTLTNSGDTFLASVGNIAFAVQGGALVLNGGPFATYSVNGGELTVGDATPNAATLTLESGTLNVATYTSVGRGNGTTGLSSRLILNGGTLNTQQLFTGHDAGFAGYNAQPRIDVNNDAVVNISDRLRLGENVGALSTLNISGNANVTATTRAEIGFGGKAVFNISDAAIFNTAVLDVGYGTNAAGNRGVGIVNQTGGTIQQVGTAGGDWRIGGALNNGGTITTNDANVYGSYTISGTNSLLNVGTRNLQIGAAGIGVLDISNGANVIASGGFPVVGRYPGSFGLLNVSGGTFSHSGAGNLLIIGEQGSGVVNVSGDGAIVISGAPGAAGNGGGTGGIRFGHTAAGAGILNLNGGSVEASGFAETVAEGTSFLYLNGGTVRAAAENQTFLQGLDNTVIGPGGAVFDTNGFNIAVGQSLHGATGSGVTTIPVADGGSGYLGQPIVQIAGGGGTGATAVANVDASGVVKSITITNPGINYTSEPTITLLGGGSTTAATVGAPVLAANVNTGGLRKQGFGTLTLSGANTYAGATVVESGALVVSGSIAGSASLEVQNGAILGGTGSIALAAGPTSDINLRGGAKLSPGTDLPGSVGVLFTTLAGGGEFDISLGVALANSQALLFDLESPAFSDKIVLSGGALNIGDGVLGFDDFVFNVFGNFDTNGTYTLFDGNTPIVGTLGSLRTGIIGGQQFTLQFADNGSDLVLAAVPEPTAVMSLLGGVGMLLGMRRRRRA